VVNLNKEGMDISQMEEKKGSGNCEICKKRMGERDNEISCDICRVWYHAGCDQVSLDLYRILEKYKEQLWFCRNCRLEVMQGIYKIKKLEEQNQELRIKYRS